MTPLGLERNRRSLERRPIRGPSARNKLSRRCNIGFLIETINATRQEVTERA
jgi:hypothetical protein